MTTVRSILVSTSGLMALVFGVFALVIVSSSWQNIRPGYVGIVFDKANHKVTARQLDPGWAYVNPFTQAIQEYPITIRTYSMLQKSSEGQVNGDDSLKVQSNEGQQLNLDTIIQYQVVKEEAAEIYKDWGGASIELVQDSVVRQYTRSVVPVITSSFGWEEITSSKRADIVTNISTRLDEEFRRRHLKLISFGIREVHLPQALQAALDQKIQAQQAAEQQTYQLKRAEIKAKQDATEAGGRANAMKAEAEGEATAILTRAKAQSEANKILAESVTPGLVHYQEIQRWDGKLPLLTGGSIPLVSLGKELKDRE